MQRYYCKKCGVELSCPQNWYLSKCKTNKYICKNCFDAVQKISDEKRKAKNMIPYRDNPAVNKSTLWLMRKSPLHYKWALEHDREDTPAMKFGRAAHSFILTPDKFYSEFILAPDVDRRTKEGKATWAELEATGKEIVKHDELDTLRDMYEAMQANKPAMSLLRTMMETEHEIYWTDSESGVACKGRTDMEGISWVADYKTTTDASTDAFCREAIRLGYDLQAAMYLEGTGKKDFYFIAQEKTAPYAVNVIKAGDAFLDRGRWIMRELLEKYKACRDDDDWYGYNPDGANELIIPEYMVMEDD